MTDKATEQEPITNEGADEQEQLNKEELENETGSEVEDTAAEEEPVDEYQKLQNELEEVKDKNLRLVAEFDNYRKRMAKERLELVATAGKETIKDLLDVLDDCDRAAKQMENDENLTSVKEGANLVFHKLRNILQQKGLKEMESMNTEFDPELHEAITEIPAPDESMQGKVIDVVQPGYYLNDKLIRHAKVVVGK